MISHQDVRVSSKTPHDKVDTARMRDMQRVAHYMLKGHVDRGSAGLQQDNVGPLATRSRPL
jgi:hypothetical protein